MAQLVNWFSSSLFVTTIEQLCDGYTQHRVSAVVAFYRIPAPVAFRAGKTVQRKPFTAVVYTYICNTGASVTRSGSDCRAAELTADHRLPS